jgi:hypothetical protein
MAGQATAVAVSAVASQTISTTPAVLRGFWIVTSGAATVTIYDNTSASGTIHAQWTTAGVADKQWDFPDGVRCAVGIFIATSAGTISGNVKVN